MVKAIFHLGVILMQTMEVQLTTVPSLCSTRVLAYLLVPCTAFLVLFSVSLPCRFLSHWASLYGFF